jgi:hypothetical protein
MNNVNTKAKGTKSMNSKNQNGKNNTKQGGNSSRNNNGNNNAYGAPIVDNTVTKFDNGFAGGVYYNDETGGLENCIDPHHFEPSVNSKFVDDPKFIGINSDAQNNSVNAGNPKIIMGDNLILIRVTLRVEISNSDLEDSVHTLGLTNFTMYFTYNIPVISEQISTHIVY